jgi:cytochrome bd-type quinol oxidase subunit 1
MLETLMLSRIQFAANISFHILFPTITIALSWFLFYFKLRFDQTSGCVLIAFGSKSLREPLLLA